MTTKRDPDKHGYVDKVRAENQAWTQKLLASIESLSERLVNAEMRNELLNDELTQARVEIAARQRREERLQQKLHAVKAETDSYLSQYAQLEQHNSNLANLYVASFQLHGTLDRDAVLAAVQEIIVNLIGSERFGIFETNGSDDFAMVASVGFTDDSVIRHPRVRDAIATGTSWTADEPIREEVSAVIPLLLDGTTTGAIVIQGLLPHKTHFEELDHDLFELLATQGATALTCSSLRGKILTARGA